MSDSPRIATRRVHSGKIIDLDLDTIRYPNGTVGELEIVRHPGACAIVPFLSAFEAPDPQIMLLRQYRYAVGQYLYEIPAGRLNSGEDAASCAHRELAEETGCSADRMTRLCSFYTTPGFTDELIHAFMATGLTRGKTNHEPDEFIEVVTRPLSDVLTMIRRGEILDAKTALSILYVSGFELDG